MAPKRLDHRPLDAAALQVDLQPDVRQTVGAECERLVEGRRGRPGQAELVGEHDRPVDKREDVELEHVAAELDGQLQRFERVLGRECRSAAVADAREPARRPAQRDHT